MKCSINEWNKDQFFIQFSAAEAKELFTRLKSEGFTFCYNEINENTVRKMAEYPAILWGDLEGTDIIITPAIYGPITNISIDDLMDRHRKVLAEYLGRH